MPGQLHVSHRDEAGLIPGQFAEPPETLSSIRLFRGKLVFFDCVAP